MSHPLDGCRAKIQRAKEQVNSLKLEIIGLLKSNTYSIGESFQPERKRYAFKVLGPPVPVRISILTGEIIHHLRSCFDHIIWALAAKNGVPDETRITFPVCETPEKYKKAIDGGIIKGVSATHRPLIEALQPYRTPDPANSIVKVIHDLDVTDKHRLLLVVATTLVKGNSIHINRSNHTDPNFGIQLFVGRGPRAIEDGEEIHWINLIGEPGTELQIYINSTIQIALAKVGTVEREPIIPILVQLCDGVERAIETFNDCF